MYVYDVAEQESCGVRLKGRKNFREPAGSLRALSRAGYVRYLSGVVWLYRGFHRGCSYWREPE